MSNRRFVVAIPRLFIATSAASVLSVFTPSTAQTPNKDVEVNSSAEAPNRLTAAAQVLLREWDGPYGGVPPWRLVNPPDFEAALVAAMALEIDDIDAITDNPARPSFENTILALEKSGQALDRLASMYYVHTSNLNVGPMPDIEATIEPKLTKHQDAITQNSKLFTRVKSVFEKGDADWTLAQQRLVEKIYKRFVRQGAQLEHAQKQRLSAINVELAGLFTQFSQNVLAEEQQKTVVENRSELDGLPESVIFGLAEKETPAASTNDGSGTENGKTKWVILNTRSSMEPVLTYADNRNLREKVWRAYYGRCDNGDTHDNNAIISAILKLRAQRAALLGYATHAHWRLEPQMAKTPENAMQLMLSIWPKAVARVKEEVAAMQALADRSGDGITIQPWDYRYYAEKVRKTQYDLDFNEVKPYLQLEKLREGMMWAAGEAFGFEFQQVENVPVFHPDVRVWEVRRNHHVVGLWYFDPFARTGKRSGAWMTGYRDQSNMDSAVIPLVSNNSNFVKGQPGTPVLISWDDAVTLFHEFGHALHGLCSTCEYPSQSGTSVARDFVEFPSQLYESWLMTPEMLTKYAVHFETGQPLPAQLRQKIEDAARFNQGFATVEYMASALVDMKLHLAGDVKIDPDQFERATLAELGMPNEIVMRHRTPHFSHVFSGDSYSAGYYSYLWAEALTADAAEAFEETGSFYHKPTARRLYDAIFSVGDTVDPTEAFESFRKRALDPGALFRKRGFVTGDQ